METEWTRTDELIGSLTRTDFRNVLILSRGVKKFGTEPDDMDISIFRKDKHDDLWVIASSIVSLEEIGDWSPKSYPLYESRIVEPEDMVLYTYFKYKDPLFFKLLEG